MLSARARGSSRRTTRFTPSSPMLLGSCRVHPAVSPACGPAAGATGPCPAGLADTARDAAALVAALRKTAEDVNRSKLVDDVSATVGKINRVVDQVEHGRGWAHALLYEEPVALKRLNETVTTTQKLLDRVAEGQGPAGVLLSPTGTDAARRFVGAMDRLRRPVDPPRGDHGLLPALLFATQY